MKDLGIVDYRRSLMSTGVPIGKRLGTPRGLTLHYNGPAVTGFGRLQTELLQLRTDATYHVAKNWSTRRGEQVRGNGIMYHFAVTSDGGIYQLRNLDEVLWHCGNATGNRTHLALHLPLGKGQEPTRLQWERVVALYEALASEYSWLGRTPFVAHCEWPRGDGPPVLAQAYRPLPGQSLCPGKTLFDLLAAYRLAALPVPRGTSVEVAVNVLNLRASPNGAVIGTLRKGDRLTVLPDVDGWSQLVDQRGWVATRHLRPAGPPAG